MSLGSFFRKHKRCFDKLMYVRSIGFKLRESTRYTIYSIMSITLQTTKISLTQKHEVTASVSCTASEIYHLFGCVAQW